MPRSPARAQRRAPLVLVAATVAAAAAGIGVATVLTPQRAPAPAAVTQGSGRVMTSGSARLPLPDDWRPLRGSRVPGLAGAPAARGLYSDVALDSRMPDDPSLLPASMLRTLGVAAPRPELFRTGNRVAWAYHLSGLDGGTSITALVLATTRGVATVACLADAAISPFEAIDCEEALAALDLAGAAPIRPTPETAARLVAGPAIARLDQRRTSGRRALASARTPPGREQAAMRIAEGYATAAGRLAPLARGAARRLPPALDALARDYRALARASARSDLTAARRAGRAIGRRERELQARLDAAPS
jgi:hypothetical protein